VAPRILVLGGGFGGLQATVELDRRLHLGRDADALLVSDQNFLLFTPLLPQVASSKINPRHIVQTVREIRGRRGFRFRREAVVGIDLAAHRVQLASASLAYDALVIALGSRSNYFGIPGAQEHSWDFKTLEDAVVLRERVLDLCEHADHTEDAAARRALLTFTIVGGGYTGVELATELRDFLFGYVARRYRGIHPQEIRVVVLEATSEVLRGVGPKLAAYARRRLAVSGIEVRTDARVTRCTDGAIEINGSETIPTATIAWTAGVRAHPLVAALPGAHDRAGRAMVNAHLQLEDHPEVFVVGDGAAAVSAPDAPLVAPVAIDHGQLAARNIAHQLRNEPLEDYNFKNKGMLVSLGMDYAVVKIGSLEFSGYFAWLFWNAVHLYKLVGLKKQLQVAVDWMLGVVFPRDASIVRRPRRCPLCDQEAKSEITATR
jgi:NADH dehydrogenase